MKTEPKCGSVRFVAIDGRAGSGKTTAANDLSKLLDAQVIHTDDFASWENPIDWWPKVIEQVFKPIASGATSLSYDRTQWWENQPRSRIVDQEVTPIMIIEGVSAFRSEFRPYISYGICMLAPKKLRMERGIKSDLSLGISEDSKEVSGYWDQWDEQEDKYFERDQPEKLADLVLDGTVPIGDQIVTE